MPPPLDRGRAMALGVGSCKVLDRTKTAFAVNMALSVLPEGEGSRVTSTSWKEVEGKVMEKVGI